MNWGFFFSPHKKRNMTLIPAKQLALFIQMPEEALRHLLHTASKFSSTMDTRPHLESDYLQVYRAGSTSTGLPVKWNNTSQMFPSRLQGRKAVIKKESCDCSEQDPAKNVSHRWERAKDYFDVGLCAAGLRWLADNSSSSPCITRMQSVFVCAVSRCTVSDWIPRDALEWQFVIDMLD